MTAAGELAVWPVRRDSEALAGRLALSLDAALYRPWEGTESQKNRRQMDAFRAAFPTARAWVLIGAAGIATRFLAGLPRSKLSDPAVVVLDDAARFAVALLGGHEGGANRLAYRVARLTGAVPVVTTGTEAVKPLTLGIGCRRGVSEAQIAAAVAHALGGRSLTEVREVATVDLKAKEAGLLAFCERHDLPLRIFAAADLEARPFVTQSSAWVQQNVGLSGVCEPCALLASPRGRLIVPKTALNGVAVAAVEDRGAWAAPQEEQP
ncbi:cobalamin (vitamin B12) biosynthesis CbiG protein (plasmid) [Deinococcus geothermalis DSM 11300]|uniref:Cobalamin (Vitamin B12) biosynthesis CbiG protein n=1 Tax=Deinococcus geothermalis (strain DSM 11300 / CIP 105573 / AG-3a) TaxID=319795 RepID=Q1J3Y7_DEIGD|nr:cobalamin biosynthesis protein [Deinococcus geothermalis]ABF43791.1 cobalamin (vitamin B12) biosynthesis CbiG protein [Deinococcus geothermalis DSM 11300]